MAEHAAHVNLMRHCTALRSCKLWLCMLQQKSMLDMGKDSPPKSHHQLAWQDLPCHKHSPQHASQTPNQQPQHCTEAHPAACSNS